MVKYLFHVADLHFRTYKRLEESKEGCEKFMSEVESFIKKNKLKKTSLNLKDKFKSKNNYKKISMKRMTK